jgi:hypothetical protein
MSLADCLPDPLHVVRCMSGVAARVQCRIPLESGSVASEIRATTGALCISATRGARDRVGGLLHEHARVA